MRTLSRLFLHLALLGFAAAQINKDLLKAVKDNNPALVNIAIKSFGKVNAMGEDGDTALMVATRGGKYKAAKALLKAKADATIPDASGLTVMHVAAAAGEARVMQVLLPGEHYVAKPSHRCAPPLTVACACSSHRVDSWRRAQSDRGGRPAAAAPRSCLGQHRQRQDAAQRGGAR